MERLAAEGWIDDLAAARSAVRTRGTRYGRARLSRELEARGFSSDTISEAFAGEGADDREEIALHRAFERLWRARPGLPAPVRRRRVFDALTRRGFSVEKISEIIRSRYEVDRS